MEDIVSDGFLLNNTVINEHNVAKFLLILLHLLLGGVYLGLRGGNIVVSIVTHMQVFTRNKHTICLEELTKVSLSHITNLSGKLQIVIGTIATLVNRILTHSTEQIRQEIVVVVLDMEVKVKLEEHTRCHPDISFQPMGSISHVFEVLARIVAT